ncbi:MAG: hypothetical protein EZS28_049819, partial [Streblomastix strix]
RSKFEPYQNEYLDLKILKIQSYIDRPQNLKFCVVYENDISRFSPFFSPHLVIYLVKLDDDEKYKSLKSGKLDPWTKSMDENRYEWMLLYLPGCENLSLSYISETQKKFKTIYSNLKSNYSDKVVKIDLKQEKSKIAESFASLNERIAQRLTNVFENRLKEIYSFLQNILPQRHFVQFCFHKNSLGYLFQQYGLYQRALDTYNDALAKFPETFQFQQNIEISSINKIGQSKINSDLQPVNQLLCTADILASSQV